jgi:acyl-CoA synthetase (AMP-forming)/AMP-acid ligase II
VSDATVVGALARTVAEHGHRVAVVDGELSLTYAQLQERALATAAALVASGVRPGDAVALWAPNSAIWITAFLGIAHSGATLIPVNTRFKGVEAGDILARGHARVLLTVTDFLDTDYVAMLRAIGADLPELRTVVVLSGDVPVEAMSWSDLLAGSTDDSRAEAQQRAGQVEPDTRCDILFTSGTTGRPKGVVQTHGRTLLVATDWVAMTGLRAGDVYLMTNPYFHMFGLKAGILACIVAGATMLPEPVFDVDRVLARVEGEQVTVLPGPPTLYQSILDHPERGRHDLSTLRVAVTGSADIPVELVRRIFAELPFRTVISGYGLTEGGTAASTDPTDDPETIATTVGRARPGFEVRLVDGEVDVEVGRTGEILLRGGSIMSHYLDDPEGTAAVLSTDGWLRTGDLAVADGRGTLRIVGRSKDMFIVGGFNAYPAEIENHLLRHPDIAQVAVIGIPDDRMGEVGMAFVVARPGSTPAEADLIAWARAEMANYKAPRRISLVTELPLGATGKVLKEQLRALL